MIRCPACRSRRATWKSLFTHLLTTGHKLCRCGGYHFAHRPGSPLCEKNAMSDVRHAARHGADMDLQLEIAAHCAWEKPGKPMKEWR